MTRSVAISGIQLTHARHVVNPLLSVIFALVLTTTLGLAGCSSEAIHPGVTSLANRAAADRPVSPELVAVLGNMAQASNNKCQLSFLADFKGLSPAAAKFNRYMGQSQKALLDQLKAWARRHHLALKSRKRRGLFGRAASLQSSSDAHALLSTSGASFERLYLLLMYTDYSWQIQLDKAALQFKIPPVPVTYLQQALKVNRHSKSVITRLLFSINARH